MSKRQSDALYARLVDKENQRLDKLASQKQRVRRSEAIQCTFQPQLWIKGRSFTNLRFQAGYESESGFQDDQSPCYRGMPQRSTSKSLLSSSVIFRRTKDIMQQRSEKALERKKLILREREIKEMENCSFKPKINSDAYLQEKHINLSTRLSTKGYQISRTTPVTPIRKQAGQKFNQIDSNKYLEIELCDEEANPENFRKLEPDRFESFKASKEKSKFT